VLAFPAISFLASGVDRLLVVAANLEGGFVFVLCGRLSERYLPLSGLLSAAKALFKLV
jgi:hypothetical protein